MMGMNIMGIYYRNNGDRSQIYYQQIFTKQGWEYDGNILPTEYGI